jgi:hypothetical protein
VSDRLYPWVVRVAWAALPFTAGPALASALDHHHTVRTPASVALWTVWALTLVAALVAHPVALTVLRTVAPAAVVAMLAATAEGHASGGLLALGLASTAVAALLALLPATAMIFINGPAYPNERRFPLAAPGPVLLGPLELSWGLTIGLPVAGVLLLADRRWLLGGLATVMAAAAVWVLGRALHGLSQRWIVFVPAGLVLHDPLSLEDPVLFERRVIEHLGPAPAGTDSLDLTQRAFGLALELVLTEKVPMVRVQPGRRGVDSGASARLLFTPTRPGAVLAWARERRLPVSLPTS